MCVFIPCIFITGITGQFFKQFAVTIAVATFFSALNSLTLSPALSALLLRPKAEQRDPFTKLINATLGWFFKLFNVGFNTASSIYARIVGGLLRLSFVVMLVYVGLLGLTYYGMNHVPSGFIPAQDKGYLLVDVQLPDSASLDRTRLVMKQIDGLILKAQNGSSENHSAVDHSPEDHSQGNANIPGVGHTIAVTGQSFIQNAVGSNYGSFFVILDEFHHRHGADLSANAIAAKIRALVAENVQDARVAVFGPPPVDGLGSGGGFKLMVRDVGSLGLINLQQTWFCRFVQWLSSLDATDVCGCGPDQMQVARCIFARSLRDAAVVSWRVLCKRFQSIRSNLASQRAGRLKLSFAPRTNLSVSSSQLSRRYGSARGCLQCLRK